MPKLSSLSPKSVVKIPIGPMTYDCIWLEYNHYGKSEVALLLENYSSVVFTINNANAKSFAGSIYDNIGLIEIPNFMDDTLRQALRPVFINDGGSTISRAIFLPSATECGVESVVDLSDCYPAYYIRYIPNGSLISALAERIPKTFSSDGSTSFVKEVLAANAIRFRGRMISTSSSTGSSPVSFIWYRTGSPVNAVNRSLTIDTYLPNYLMGKVTNTSQDYPSSGTGGTFTLTVHNSWSNNDISIGNDFGIGAYNAGNQSINDSASQYFGDPKGYISVWASVNDVYSVTTSAFPSPPLIMCLDGNCEVTSSGDSYIFGHSNAVETYRKIDGVWRRTI